MKRAQRLFRIRTALANQFHVRNTPIRPTFDGERGEREAVAHRCPGFTDAQGLVVCGHQHDFVECQRRHRRLRCIEVADVNGIECATENAQAPTLHAAGTGISRTAAI